MRTKHRIKSKFRFCLFLTLIMVLLISVQGIINGSDQALSLTKPIYTEITIISGDTLWDLAKEYGPADQDVRKIVHAICNINNISADKLQSGQKIMIPKYL